MSVARNYVYNTILQITNILVPFITVPYLSRVLGPEGVGIVAFSGSIVQYFILFGVLGLTLYGNRSIAYVSASTEERSRVFWELVLLKAASTALALVAFYLFLQVTSPQNLPVYLVQSTLIIAAALDVSWLFMGMEDFKKTVTRSLFMKLLGASLIFILVKTSQDFVLYALIGAGTTLFGQLIMWTYVPKYIEKVSFNSLRFRRHLRGTVRLFIPTVAVEVYVVLDKTMIGLISTDAEVGIYEMSQRLVKMALSLVTSMGVVMIPRMSAVVARRDSNLLNSYARRSFHFATYGSIFVAAMIMGVIPDFAPMFFGEAFLKTVDVIRTIVPVVVFIAWSNVLGMQLMVPMKLERRLTLSVSLGAMINFPLNLLLIPFLGAIGAAISSVVAEFSVTASQLFLMRKEIKISSLFSEFHKHLLSGIVALTLMSLISALPLPPLALVFLELLVGAITYLVMQKLFKTEINALVIAKLRSFLKRS